MKSAIKKVYYKSESCEICGSTHKLSGHHVVPMRIKPLGDNHIIIIVCEQCHETIENHLYIILTNFYNKIFSKEEFLIRFNILNFRKTLKKYSEKLPDERKLFMENYLKTYSYYNLPEIIADKQMLREYDLCQKFGKNKILKWYESVSKILIKKLKNKYKKELYETIGAIEKCKGKKPDLCVEMGQDVKYVDNYYNVSCHKCFINKNRSKYQINCNNKTIPKILELFKKEYEASYIN